MEEKKEIRLEKMKVGDMKHTFGNPRKISKKKAEELERSMELLGDFGIFIVDEDDNVIAGNQRSKILARKDPDIVVDVKRLIGYSEAEKRAINIKDNTHAGEWDLDLLSDWTADLSIDLGLDAKEKNPEERKIKDLELIRYEKYDYVMIVCRNEVDYLNLQRLLGIDNGKVLIAKRRRIKARAVWYDQIKAQIVPKKENGTDEEEHGESKEEEK